MIGLQAPILRRIEIDPTFQFFELLYLDPSKSNISLTCSLGKNEITQKWYKLWHWFLLRWEAISHRYITTVTQFRIKGELILYLRMLRRRCAKKRVLTILQLLKLPYRRKYMRSRVDSFITVIGLRASILCKIDIDPTFQFFELLYLDPSKSNISLTCSLGKNQITQKRYELWHWFLLRWEAISHRYITTVTQFRIIVERILYLRMLRRWCAKNRVLISFRYKNCHSVESTYDA